MRWAHVRKGHRVEEITEEEGCGQKEWFQSPAPINIVTGSKLGGKYVVRRKAEVSRERRKRLIVMGVRKCDSLKKQVLVREKDNVSLC